MNELPQVLNAFGGWLASHLWQMSIELALLAAGVAPALFLLRTRSASLRPLVWCLVLAKPVMTFLIALTCPPQTSPRAVLRSWA